MRRFRWASGVAVFALTGALVGVVPDGVSAVPARARCRATAFVTNTGSNTVSTIDVKSRTKNATDITVGTNPAGVAVTPDGIGARLVADRRSVSLRAGSLGHRVNAPRLNAQPLDVLVERIGRNEPAAADGRGPEVACGDLLVQLRPTD